MLKSKHEIMKCSKYIWDDRYIHVCKTESKRNVHMWQLRGTNIQLLGEMDSWKKKTDLLFCIVFDCNEYQRAVATNNNNIYLRTVCCAAGWLFGTFGQSRANVFPLFSVFMLS